LENYVDYWCHLLSVFTILRAVGTAICTWWAKKTWHFTFVRVFANYWSIFKIRSLAHSADNLR